MIAVISRWLEELTTSRLGRSISGLCNQGFAPQISRGVVPAQCKTDCIYEREDKPGSRYCFARGKLDMQCMDGRQVTLWNYKYDT